MTDLLIPTSGYRELTIEEILRRKAVIDEAAARDALARKGASTDMVDRVLDAQTITYHGLEIEMDTPHEADDVLSKQAYTFDASLARLRKRGFERHLRPSEVMGVFAEHLTNRDDYSKETAIVEDMLLDKGEWLDLVFERRNGELHCCEGVSNLRWDDTKNRYVMGGNFLDYETHRRFDINLMPSGLFIYIEDLRDDLVTYLYGAPIDMLPTKMMTGDERAKIILPQEGVIRPVGRRQNHRYDLDCTIDRFASRGCRYAQGDGR